MHASARRHVPDLDRRRARDNLVVIAMHEQPTCSVLSHRDLPALLARAHVPARQLAVCRARVQQGARRVESDITHFARVSAALATKCLTQLAACAVPQQNTPDRVADCNNLVHLLCLFLFRRTCCPRRGHLAPCQARERRRLLPRGCKSATRTQRTSAFHQPPCLRPRRLLLRRHHPHPPPLAG